VHTVNWWFSPVALGRVAALRVLVALYVPLDLWLSTSWVHEHGDVPPELYQPVALARLLQVPAATPLSADLLRSGMTVLSVAMLIAVIWRRVPDAVSRIVGAGLGIAYLWWMLLAMSYGKVDHDRYAFLVLLAVLPTVAGARLGDRDTSESAGWAIRMVQVAVVATYFLAAVAKIRFGGWGWANGATFARAIIRRGTDLVDWMVQYPWTLRVSQWAMLVLELAAPLLLLIRRERTMWIVIGSLYAFHLMTYAALGIIFLPHLVALAAFLPLERLGRQRDASR
jgi:hypothetical protein